MEKDYRLTKLHGTLLGDNRIPDLPDSETAKILSSANGKTEWADLPTDLKATATNLSLLAGSAKIGSGINLSGFEYDEATNTLKASGGGGASVSPCLNLLDMTARPVTIRTSITEEELLNLQDGLYNSVLFFDESAGQFAFASMAFPEPLTTQAMDIPSFSIFNLAVDTDTNKVTITGSSIYGIEIRDKNADGNYPISIQKMEEATFGGGGGGAIQEIEAIKSTEDGAEANQYTLSSTPTSSMFIMKVKNYDGVYSRFTMILQSLNKSNQAYFGFKVDSLSPDSNTCVYAYSEGTTAILSNQCYLPPEIKSGDSGKVLIARGDGYRLEDLPSSLPNVSQSDIGKYLVVGNNQEASWQNLPESTSTIIRRW